ncbi:MAG TPA: FAD-dependent monooxygenase [Thermoleophilaceae bacterium]|jgi:2,6-dihydroxypyridine 3-monooxygenase|nr:FAD-dependent monooxygenase [Thermoleophilaceae bacterium]
MSRRAIVVGGSLGGLTAALLLRDLGWSVDVFERSPRLLMARGVGIVAHPASVRYLLERRGTDLRTMTSASRSVRYMDDSGRVVHELPFDYLFTSFYALYRELLDSFDIARYHLSRDVVGLTVENGEAEVVTSDGERARSDLVVCADGIHSTGRGLLLPEIEPEYAGYVAWRGVVSEADLSEESFARLHEAITYFLMPNGHILTYPIPNTDGSVEPGRRLINWIWYRNVPAGPKLDDLMTDRRGTVQQVSLPPGGVRREHVEELRDTAQHQLAPPLAEMVMKSDAPFVQVVLDIEAPRLAFGRACLIGDAATVLRPHVAVGTAKAAEAAWRLADAIEASNHNVPAALKRWEPGQLELERSVLERTREAGRRSQIDNSWSVGDPLPFGLYEEGDSVLSLREETA